MCCNRVTTRFLVDDRTTNLKQARLCYNRLDVHGVDKRLAEGDTLDTRVVEAVDVVPDWWTNQNQGKQEV
jgi:hypothetical protein